MNDQDFLFAFLNEAAPPLADPFGTLEFAHSTTSSSDVFDLDYALTSTPIPNTSHLNNNPSLAYSLDSIISNSSFNSYSSSSNSLPQNSQQTRKRPRTFDVANDEDPRQSKRERNRIAAEKCRLKKVELIASLQRECSQLKAERERLVQDNERLLRALQQQQQRFF